MTGFALPELYRVPSKVLGVGLLIDQGTKLLAGLWLPEHARVSIVEGHVALRYAINPGLMLGVLGEEQSVLRSIVVKLFPLGVAALLWWLWLRVGAESPWARWGLLACFTGTVGNLLDRWLAGSVTDFLELRLVDALGSLTINVADLYVVSGVMLLVKQMGSAPTAGALEE